MQGQTLRALVACLMTTCVLAPAATAARMGATERAVVERINDVRGRHGLAPLRGDKRLTRAADAHSRDMLRQDFFAHSSSNGTSPHDRIRHYRPARLVGETLAYVPKGGRASARSVVRMWKRSAGHRAVLTTARFRRIGVSRKRGRLQGRKVTMFTADFSSRR